MQLFDADVRCSPLAPPYAVPGFRRCDAQEVVVFDAGIAAAEDLAQFINEGLNLRKKISTCCTPRPG